MILEVPFVYKAQVVLGKKRNPDTVTLAGSAPCEIREVTDAQAPVAMWWADGESRPQECIRSFDGALYAPLTQSVGRWNSEASHELDVPAHAATARRWAPSAVPADDGDEPDEEFGRPLDADGEGNPPALPTGVGHLVSTASLAANLAAGTLSISGREAGCHEREPAKDDLERLPVRKIVSSTYDHEVAQVRETANHLLSVDGIVFTRVERPVYTLKVSERGQVEMRLGFADGYHSVGDHAFFAERYDQMRELWRSILMERATRDGQPVPDPDGGYFYGRLPAPDIVRPELMPDGDQLEFQLRRGGKSIVDYLSAHHNGWYGNYSGGPYLCRYDRPVILAFARLRDGLAADAPAAELADLMSRMGEACGPHGTLWSIRTHADTACRVADAAFEDDIALGAI